MRYSDYYWDNFKFVVHELFLYTIAILLKEQRFDLLLQLISEGYYVDDALDPSRPILEFGIVRQHMSSLKHQNDRLKLNRLSVRADLLERRSHTSGLPLHDLMQADFILFIADAIRAAN